MGFGIKMCETIRRNPLFLYYRSNVGSTSFKNLSEQTLVSPHFFTLDSKILEFSGLGIFKFIQPWSGNIILFTKGTRTSTGTDSARTSAVYINGVSMGNCVSDNNPTKAVVIPYNFKVGDILEIKDKSDTSSTRYATTYLYLTQNNILENN